MHLLRNHDEHFPRWQLFCCLPYELASWPPVTFILLQEGEVENFRAPCCCCSTSGVKDYVSFPCGSWVFLWSAWTQCESPWPQSFAIHSPNSFLSTQPHRPVASQGQFGVLERAEAWVPSESTLMGLWCSGVECWPINKARRKARHLHSRSQYCTGHPWSQLPGFSSWLPCPLCVTPDLSSPLWA